MCIPSSCLSAGRKYPVPIAVDLSINKIILRDAQSAEKVLGEEIELDGMVVPKAHYYNKKKTEILTIVFHNGDQRNEFSEFIVRSSTEMIRGPIHRLPAVSYFKTGKGVRLGITKKELSKRLGRFYVEKENSEDKTTVLTYDISEKPTERYDWSLYYGRYVFKDGRLIEFAFGFQYP
ncbi:MAG: hypothetical protein GF384_01700 [Elusimicrobia bacterium]|nr:hypothetical protein [Elusimicrobiota bacterium]